MIGVASDRRAFLKFVLKSGVTVAILPNPNLLGNPRFIEHFSTEELAANTALDKCVDQIVSGLRYQPMVRTLGDLPTKETTRWDEYFSHTTQQMVREPYVLTDGDAVFVEDISTLFVRYDGVWVQVGHSVE